ncbi:MAG: glutamine--fructose-6-phosphate transaminase (isomerizing) [Candidatus Moraniibacteriota bacterium]|nr:MAG: glutamine--fructose-6-phosphate transaminase (isomerizing) [Candidatus Moranbacteria bacterium]
MCGIVGFIGKKDNAYDVLLDGLKRLEYRGYDSSGMCLLSNDKVKTFRSVGKISSLEEKIGSRHIESHMGIAHTRWATHGKPSVKNAHPHSSGKIHLVHNGIIENYQQLKSMLVEKGHKFTSDTDSEVVAHLIAQENKKSGFEESVYNAMAQIHGAYALVICHEDEPEKMIAVRNSSPLVMGVGKNEYILASDASAIVQHTDRVIYLDDGELIILTPTEYKITTLRGKKKNKKEHILEWTDDEAQKEGYNHFMIKEIFEQPHAIEDAIRGRMILSDGLARLGGLKDVEKRLRNINRIVIVSCGTSYCAGLVGEYMLEEYAGISTEVEYASEFRYRKPLIDKNTVVIAISQSGETADTLAAIREAKNKGGLTLGIVNVVGSTIARETDAGIYNHAGPEVAVASTKAFTSQLSILALLTVYLGRQRNMSMVMGKRILAELQRIPKKINTILESEKEIKKIAKKYIKYNSMFYLGRKYNFPIALEGAIKIKEISYVHAEGYASGEMKHGPIALIDKNFPSVIIAVKDSVYEKTLSAIEEVKARDGKVIAITTKGSKEVEKIADHVLYIPKTLEMLTPLLSIIPLQLLAYYTGVEKGFDVDKPRNLAKSVTVE